MWGQMQHLYITAHGAWHTGDWLGESAQFGLRLTYESGHPQRGAEYTPGTNGNAVADYGTQSGPNGTLTKGWTARVGLLGSTDNCDADAQIDLAEDIRTFLDAIKSFTASSFRWTHVKFSPVGIGGKAEAYSSTYTFTSPVTGTATGHLPPQIALAVSLRAPVLGRKGRGRFYLPAIATSTLTNDGKINATNAATIRGHAVTLLGNLENPSGTPDVTPHVAIMSAGADKAIRPTQVRTGNRFDTIRSRRQQVAEVYTATELT